MANTDPPCCICGEPAGIRAGYCLRHWWPEKVEPPVTAEQCEYEYFDTETDARIAWCCLKLLQGYAPEKLPMFPGDRPVRQPGQRGSDLFRRVKDAVPVEGLAGRFTTLIPAGADRLKGRCPLHEEKTPSFYIFESKGTWRCFGACAEGGDVVRLARRLLEKGLLQ
jgi:hypothetical protein